MPILVEFLEEEKIVGYINIPSGSLLLVDGAFEVDLKLNSKHSLALDLQMEGVRIPVMSTQQNGKRYLLIPLDSAQAIDDSNGTIATTDKVPEQEVEKDDAEK